MFGAKLSITSNFLCSPSYCFVSPPLNTLFLSRTFLSCYFGSSSFQFGYTSVIGDNYFKSRQSFHLELFQKKIIKQTVVMKIPSISG